MFKYYLTNTQQQLIINEKLHQLFLKPERCTNTLTVSFFLSSKMENRRTFIALILLMEKLTNQKVKFVFDRATLKNKVIKIGCTTKVKNKYAQMFYSICWRHSLSHFSNEQIEFVMAKSPYLAYQMKKILFNAIFNYDKDSDAFYDLFAEAVYDIKFVFETKHPLPQINLIQANINGFFAEDTEAQEKTPEIQTAQLGEEELLNQIDFDGEEDIDISSDEENEDE